MLQSSTTLTTKAQGLKLKGYTQALVRGSAHTDDDALSDQSRCSVFC